MSQRRSRWSLIAGFMLVWALVMSGPAAAETIIADRELFDTVFPANSVINRDDIPLGEDIRQRIDKRFHFRPRTVSVSVWLARDPGDGRLLGGVLKTEAEYQQRPVTIAVAMSAEQRIIRATIVAIDPAIRPAFEATIGIGYIKRYTMLAVRQLSYLAKVLARRDLPSAWASEQIFRQGAVLATILDERQAGSRR